MLIRNRSQALLVSLALALAPACGDDDDTDTRPDAAPSGADASTPDIDGSPDAPDAMPGAPDAMPGAPDAMPTPDAMPLVGIDGARGASDGTVDIDITSVLVTYTKVAVGSDVAGFFVQSAMTGPALFIAVDPAGLDPVPAIGDNVTFTVTEMDTAGMLRQATAISGWTVNSSGNSVTGLAQELSDATDLVSAIGDYEAELSIVAFIIAGDFASAGSEHQAAVVNTAGITGDTDLRLRVPTTLRDSLGLVNGCDLKVEYTPMWRFGTAAQISAWNASELKGSCPAPTVVSASAPTSDTEVVVTFDRDLAAGTVNVDGSQFTFDNGLTASAASVSGNTVTVTTSAQTTGVTYTVTAATSIMDVFGVALSDSANTATFDGYGSPEAVCNDGLDDDSDLLIDCLDSDCAEDSACAWASQLYLWEVDADQTGTDSAEFVEIWNNTGATVDFSTSKYFLVFLNGGLAGDLSYDAIQLTGTLASDALHVVGATGVPNLTQDLGAVTGIIQNGADGVLLVMCNDCTDATTDFPDDTDVGTAATFTTGGGKTATKIDAIAYDTADSDDTALWDKLGVAAQWDENANASSATHSNQRTSLAGWIAATANPGVTGPE